MKKTLIAAIMVLSAAYAAATVRPVPEAFPVKQADGTTVTLYNHGNGYHAFYTTLDNQVVIRNDEGVLCYAYLDNGELVASSVVVHDIAERTDEEAAFVAANTLKPEDVPARQSASETANVNRVSASSAGDGLGIYGTTAGGSLSSIGEVTIPIIMVEYADVAFQDGMTAEKLTRFFNDEGYCEDNTRQVGSVKDYFKAQSRGLFVPSFDVVAKVTVSNNYSYYGANSSTGADAKAWNLVKEAMELAISDGVDFSQYKVNGVIPNIIVCYAGLGEATGGDENTIWPHTAELTGYYSTLNGFTVKSYFLGNELYGTSTSNMVMGMGVFVHEFSHVLGLPDLYDTTSSYSYDYPFGYWSVMDVGCYANYAYAPVGYTAYERSFMGWYDMPELTEATAVTLTDPNEEEGDFAVIFRNPSDNNEYFVLENRQPGTWYNNTSGLLVSHFTFNSNSWTANTLNTNQDYKRAYVVTADGSELNSSTLSASEMYGNGTNNKTEHELYDKTTLSDLPIYKIIPQPDSTLTFNFIDRELIGTAAVNGEIYEHVTDVSNLASGDTIIIICDDDAVAMTYTQQNSNNRAVTSVSLSDDIAYGNDAVLKLALLQSTTGWGLYYAEGKLYMGASNSGLKFSSKAGTTCVATISITDGDATIEFGGSASCPYLGYDADDVSFSCYSEPTGTLQIYRKTDSTSTGINRIASSESTDSDVYDLSGRRVGSSLNGLTKGIYTVNGKKYIVR